MSIITEILLIKTESPGTLETGEILNKVNMPCIGIEKNLFGKIEEYIPVTRRYQEARLKEIGVDTLLLPVDLFIQIMMDAVNGSKNNIIYMHYKGELVDAKRPRFFGLMFP